MRLPRQQPSSASRQADHPPSLRPPPSPPYRPYYNHHHHLKRRSLHRTVLLLLGLISGAAVLGLYHCCLWEVPVSAPHPPSLVVTSPATASVQAKFAVPITTTTTTTTTPLPLSAQALSSGNWFEACLPTSTTVWEEWQGCFISHLATENKANATVAFHKFIATSGARNLWSTSNHTAVLLEFRAWERELLFSINNVLTNLPVHWRIQIVGGPAIIGLAHQLFRLYIQAGKMVLTNLGYDTMGQEQISQVLTSLEFYQQLLGGTWLFFQYDSAISSPQRHLLSSFSESKYGWWGAPWVHWKRAPSFCGNGGFSLRKRAFVTNILTLFPWVNQTESNNEDWHMCNMAADLFLLNRTALLHAPNLLPAPRKKAKQFSVEMYYHEKPFGVHAFWRSMPANATRLKPFLEACPEAWESLPVNVLKNRREWRSVLCAEEGVSEEEKRRRRYWEECAKPEEVVPTQEMKKREGPLFTWRTPVVEEK